MLDEETGYEQVPESSLPLGKEQELNQRERELERRERAVEAESARVKAESQIRQKDLAAREHGIEMSAAAAGIPTDSDIESFVSFIAEVKNADAASVKVTIQSRAFDSLDTPRLRGSAMFNYRTEDLDSIMERIGKKYGPGEYWLSMQPVFKDRANAPRIPSCLIKKNLDIVEFKGDEGDLKKEIQSLRSEMRTGGGAPDETNQLILKTLMNIVESRFKEPMPAPLPASLTPTMSNPVKETVDVFKLGIETAMQALRAGGGVGGSYEGEGGEPAAGGLEGVIAKVAGPIINALTNKMGGGVTTPEPPQGQVVNPTINYITYVLQNLIAYLKQNYASESLAGWIRMNLAPNQIKSLVETPLDQIIRVAPDIAQYIPQLQQIFAILKQKPVVRVMPEQPVEQQPRPRQSVQPQEEPESKLDIRQVKEPTIPTFESRRKVVRLVKEDEQVN